MGSPRHWFIRSTPAKSALYFVRHPRGAYLLGCTGGHLCPEFLAAPLNMKNRAHSVLVILPNAIGDIVVSLPMLEAISRAGWLCDVVIDEAATGLGRLYAPWVNRELSLPVKRWRRTSILSDLRKRLTVTASVRRNRYEALICMSGVGSLSAWLAIAAGIPIRVTEKRRESAPFKRIFRRFIFSHRLDFGNDCNNRRTTHVAAQYMALLKPLGINIPLEEDRILQRAPHGRIFVGDRKVPRVLIAPEASETGRSLPLQEVIAIVNGLREASRNLDISTVGLPGGIAYQAARELGLPAGIGLSLDALVDAIARSHCVIAVDSGPGHIAAACGVPLVSIFGPGNPVTFRPLGDTSNTVLLSKHLACQPCLENGCRGSGRAECLVDLPIMEIIDAALQFLRID